MLVTISLVLVMSSW